jgi:tetratricopeptide (TPR) repeat protein
MLAPVIRPGGGDTTPPPSPGTGLSTVDDEPADPGAADPEQVLAGYRWRFHHDTLRELVEEPDELREIRDRLTEKLKTASDNPTRARLLSLRAVVSRILGELGKALSDGKLAVAHAEATGELRRIAIVQARLAHVLQWRGDFAEADRLFEEAASSEAHEAVRSVVHENAGRSCFDQGRHMEALDHFARAIRLGSPEDMDLVERIDVSLEAVYIHVLRDGWGPYPRLRREILGYVRPQPNNAR